MITEDYVSFETAKLLKERGFDEPCTHVCNIESGKILEADFYTCRYVYNSWLDKNESRLIAAPTFQMAMKWLREVHNIFIQVELYSKYDNYCFELFQNTHRLVVEKHEVYNSYEEACEAAIKYCLENLI